MNKVIAVVFGFICIIGLFLYTLDQTDLLLQWAGLHILSFCAVRYLAMRGKFNQIKALMVLMAPVIDGMAVYSFWMVWHPVVGVVVGIWCTLQVTRTWCELDHLQVITSALVGTK